MHNPFLIIFKLSIDKFKNEDSCDQFLNTATWTLYAHGGRSSHEEMSMAFQGERTKPGLKYEKL